MDVAASAAPASAHAAGETKMNPQQQQQTPSSHPNPNQNASQAPAKATTIENGVQTGGAKKPESCCGEKKLPDSATLHSLYLRKAFDYNYSVYRIDTFHWVGPEEGGEEG